MVGRCLQGTGSCDLAGFINSFCPRSPWKYQCSIILRETGRQVLLNMFLVLDLLLRMLFNALNLLPGIKLPL